LKSLIYKVTHSVTELRIAVLLTPINIACQPYLLLMIFFHCCPAKLSSSTIKKLENLGMIEYVDVLGRNLKAIVENQ
jgi:hypothetical protein